MLRGGNCYVQADGYTRTITGRRRKEEASGPPPRGFLPAFQNYTPVKAANAMTEALNAYQLTVLRRAAAAGHVSIMTAEERPALDELLERKLVLGNQLTESGWRQLQRARGSLEGLIPFASLHVG